MKCQEQLKYIISFFKQISKFCLIHKYNIGLFSISLFLIFIFVVRKAH